MSSQTLAHAPTDTTTAPGPPLTLVSHVLCPYVQRAAIMLNEKGVPFQRRDVDLADKPDWFLAVSPLGKTPVLLVGDKALFESAVICEYLDETVAPRWLPSDPLARARQRAWVAFGSAVLDGIARFYNAADTAALLAARDDLAHRFAQVEDALTGGPYFGGEQFGLVDAVFAPVFRYFDVFDRHADFGVFAATPRVRDWRERLARRPSVRAAVGPLYPELLTAFVHRRAGALAQAIASA